jgi:ribosomal protein S18 acetylase RimI-like enzyme
MIRLGLARRVESADIVRLCRRLIEQDLPPSWTDERVGRSIADPESVVLAARDRRQLVGFAIMAFLDDCAHLNLLAVQPGHQRQGVGRSLLEWLEASARTAGIFRVELELRETNDRARRFYERLGYTVVGRRFGYYAGREHALRMARDLTVSPAAAP